MSRVFRLLLLVAASVMLIGATPQLNPLVQRLPQPSRSAPAECEEGLSAIPVEPRPVIEDIPLPEVQQAGEVTPPPSARLRSQLAAVQYTLETSDRAGFDASLAALRRTLADYPRGGERTAAEAALQVYEDARRVWDAQFEAPFFSRESDLYTTLSRYPGYEDAIRRQVLAGQYYPARESRDFLATVARTRVGAAGVRGGTTPSRQSPSRNEDTDREPLPPVKPRVSVREVAPPPREQTSRPRTSAGGSTAAARPSSGSGRTSTAPRVTRTPSSSDSSAGPRSTIRTSPPPVTRESAAVARAGSPSPATASPVVSDTVPPDADEPPPSTGVVAAPDTAAVTDTASTAAPTTGEASTAASDTALSGATSTESSTTVAQSTETAAAAEAPPVERSRARKIVIPALLVLVGIIILVMLFRAS